MATLTKKQKEILDFIKNYIKKHGISPTFEEIGKHINKSFSTTHEHVNALIKKGVLTKNHYLSRGLEIKKNEEMILIPLLGAIAAGRPIEAIENKETIAVPKNKLPPNGNFYALRVNGDSMIEEGVNHNDIILVKQQPTAENGQKVVALINNNEATLKKFYQQKGYIRLQPANQNYSPIIINKGDDFAIQGVILDVIKNITSDEKEKLFIPNIEKVKKSNKLPINNIICNDCIIGLNKLPHDSIDGCVTDPPYNYEFIGHTWNDEEIRRRTERIRDSKTLIKYIPYGSGLSGGVRNKRWYKKNTENIQDYQNWCLKWGKEIFRVLKPGAYIFVFNSSRTIAHIQVALEKVGFYTRDILVWRKNSGIPKGLNFVKKLEKEGIKNSKKWEGWHSCLRNEWEAIALLQKPLTNNYLETVKKFDVGLLHTKNFDGSFQSNIIENIKKDKKENFNFHCTVKPISLIFKLIKLILPLDKSKIVLDPFMGSGTTAIAALDVGVSYIGFEINKNYCEISKKRVKKYIKDREQRLL